MTDPRTPSGSGPPAPGDRLDAALQEATRDLKGYFAREVDAKLAVTEERLRSAIADVTAELQSVALKLAAVREELAQSLREQTLRLTFLVLGAACFTVVALLLVSRWMR